MTKFRCCRIKVSAIKVGDRILSLSNDNTVVYFFTVIHIRNYEHLVVIYDGEWDRCSHNITGNRLIFKVHPESTKVKNGFTDYWCEKVLLNSLNIGVKYG